MWQSTRNTPPQTSYNQIPCTWWEQNEKVQELQYIQTKRKNPTNFDDERCTPWQPEHYSVLVQCSTFFRPARTGPASDRAREWLKNPQRPTIYITMYDITSIFFNILRRDSLEKSTWVIGGVLYVAGGLESNNSRSRLKVWSHIYACNESPSVYWLCSRNCPTIEIYSLLVKAVRRHCRYLDMVIQCSNYHVTSLLTTARSPTIFVYSSTFRIS